MKLVFFVMEFPVPSETFVMNQITYFIDHGYDVNIIAVFPGDFINTHKDFVNYKLASKTTFLLPRENKNKILKVVMRSLIVASNFYKYLVRDALSSRQFGIHSKNLILPSIMALNNKKIDADYFLVHFGFSGVLANKLRKLGLFNGKIATIFHGADISRADVLSLYHDDYIRLFDDTEILLPVSYLWRNKLITLGCKPDKIRVIRMGINPKNFKLKKIRAPGLKLKILTIARLEDKKGINIAIEACAILKARGVQFSYEVIGSGVLMSNLQEQIDKLHLKNDVKLLGFKAQEDIMAYLNEADLFLLPSRTAENGDMEGIPVALMESMAVGTPVISTYHSGIPELIEDKVTGWLAPENNAICIANIIEKIVKSGDSNSLIITNAREKIEKEFNQLESYASLERVLNEFM
ncbi:glycosyltransferase [Sodalis sp. RH19]|uniref:glycosyltransferase n=1 Tax=Sodalis sp. RH19 TaxID=3394334 RepID=UPI0039B64B6D